ncbi:MAG: Ig-like domain-containing protein [Myxococcota bacterium]
MTVDAQPAVVVKADDAGAWSVTPTSALDDGPHSARADVADAAGNPASATVSFSVKVKIPDHVAGGNACAAGDGSLAPLLAAALAMLWARRRCWSRASS